MLRRRQLLVASLLLVPSIHGCTDYADRRDAEQVLDRHFQALAHRSYDAALNDYHDSFFSEVTRPEWRALLASVVDKLGTFQGYDVKAFGLASRMLAGPGTYLRFQCKVTYSKHAAEETFYLFRKRGANEFKILGHQIDSDGLSSK